MGSCIVVIALFAARGSVAKQVAKNKETVQTKGVCICRRPPKNCALRSLVVIVTSGYKRRGTKVVASRFVVIVKFPRLVASGGQGRKVQSHGGRNVDNILAL